MADDISLIVIHAISLPPGEFGTRGIDDLFLNTLDPDAHPYYRDIAHLRVSAHLVIGRLGQLTQYVSFDRRAWHAGVSSYRGRATCNDFSIGIEMEGTGEENFEDAQYVQLANVIEGLLIAYPKLDRSRITGHQNIAPDRKWDPGPCFDWSRLGVDPRT